jgi:hypothetical protein
MNNDYIFGAPRPPGTSAVESHVASPITYGPFYTKDEQIASLKVQVERLTGELAEYTQLKKYAASLGQRTYFDLHAKNERLRAHLKELIEYIELDSEYPYSMIYEARSALEPEVKS